MFFLQKRKKKITIFLAPFFSSSNVDVMLYSVFENEEALKGYAVHPDHVYVADTFVRPYTETRSCMDFEI